MTSTHHTNGKSWYQYQHCGNCGVCTAVCVVPCHVVATEKRPVPLNLYVVPSGQKDLCLVVDEKGEFKEKNFKDAMNVLKVGGHAAMKGKKGGIKGKSECYNIVKQIMLRNLAPVIVFSFSRKYCKTYAMEMASLDFTSEEEKKLIEKVFKNAVDVLSDDDKELPQVKSIFPLLKKGIGIHHSGLLPIVKETIEMLFSQGLIKALFATETFAMGLNMPARTVLFTSARKFDGEDFRWLTPAEFIQMSGRAGRRGLDGRGTVILIVDEKMSPAIGKDIVKGLPDPINSAFRLTYNMVLNLLRVEDINPEYILERSFFHFQNYTVLPILYNKLSKLHEQYRVIEIENEADIEVYYNMKKQIHHLNKYFQAYIKFLKPGVLVTVKEGDKQYGWGVVTELRKKSLDKDGESYEVDALLNVSEDVAKSKIIIDHMPPAVGVKGVMKLLPIKIELIEKISTLHVQCAENMNLLANRMAVLERVKKCLDQHPQGVPVVSLEMDFEEVVKKIQAFNSRLHQHTLHKNPSINDLLTIYEKKLIINDEIKKNKFELKKARSLLQMDELKCRKRVLRRLGYCTTSDMIAIKGRVACEISSADELVLTEMIFNGAFNDLDIHQTTAILSCFVFQEKSNEMPKLTIELSGILRLMQDTARRIATISKESKLEIDTEIYVGSFRPNLMDVVHAWSNGATFAHICQMTDVFEGSIIRCMRRLEELLRQMVAAAKTIGNAELEIKFSEAIKFMKRDIVFASSLYL